MRTNWPPLAGFGRAHFLFGAIVPVVVVVVAVVVAAVVFPLAAASALGKLAGPAQQQVARRRLDHCQREWI